MWESLLKILATVLDWLTNRPVVDSRVRRLEDAAEALRAEKMREFDAKAAAVRTADDAAELLNSVTQDAQR
jgi:hypothetical protein